MKETIREIKEALEYFWQENSYILSALLICIAFFGAVIYFSVWFTEATCNAKTADIGFDHRWDIMSGCMVEVEPGQWIPLENYYFKQE